MWKCLILLFLLTGCAVQYKVPTSGDTANVRIGTRVGNDHTWVYGYSNAQCDDKKTWLRLIGEPMASWAESSKRLGMPLWDYPNGAAHEILVPANKAQYIMAVQNHYTFKCGTFISHTFDKNKDYEIIIGDQHRCSASIYEIVPTSEQSTDFKRALIKTVSMVDGVSQACKDKF